MINCVHWSPCDQKAGGCCAKGLFGGRPSQGVCRRVCKQRTPGEANPPSNDWSGRGPALWADLHRWALTADLNPGAPGQWLDRFAARVPCGDCRRHWLEITAASPPALESHQALFAWTVARHNDVNRRLGKPEMSLDEAIGRWSNQPLVSSARGQWRINRRRHQITALPNPLPTRVEGISHLFDAVWCINLDADTERWAEFQQRLAASDWPFCPITRFSAIHGDTVGVPDHFHQGGGAWGCLQSHRRVLELSLMAGHQRVLVMEDDVDLRPGFGAAARKFFADLGDEPWDCLMLGGQHIATPRTHKPGVVRAGNIQRTHCMAFSRAFMRELCRHWSGPIDQHCDWALGPLAAGFATFAPQRFIAGQSGGRSWITGNQKPPEWWNPPREDAPVIWLRCPRAVLESCRDIFHAGNRRNADGICVGLADVFDPAKNPTEREQIAALKGWISMIQWEVESRGDGSVCTIWHPGAKAEVVRPAAGSVLLELNTQTEEEARENVNFR
jgi:Erv1 / Alr family